MPAPRSSAGQPLLGNIAAPGSAAVRPRLASLAMSQDDPANVLRIMVSTDNHLVRRV